jgi:hypothetical protein
MEFLKKLPAILQQHYEKVVLGLALAALVLSGLLLTGQKESQDAEIKQYGVTVSKRRDFGYSNIVWGPFTKALQLATNPVSMNFKSPRLHNLFGPVKWQERPDGRLLKIEKGNEVGAEALKITKIAPLYLTVVIDKASGANGFFMSVTREAATNVVQRRKYQSYITPGQKDRLITFVLKDIKGTPEEPELTLELTDSGEKIKVFKDKPFQRVDGYKVDFSYPPENKAFTEKRLNDTITLGGEDYIIIAISESEVVLSARSNNKRTTLRYNAAL